MGKSRKTKDNVKKTKKKKTGLKVFIFILLVLAVLGGIFAKRVYDLDGNWIAAILGHNKNTLKNLNKIEILVLGESTGSTDTIMVCSYDPKTQTASMLSIPRDTFVGTNKNRAKYTDKINSLYSAGNSPEKTVEAVNKITGLNISNYILVDTEALIKLVDTIGGLEFNVPIDMKYDDYSQDLHVNLKAGMQKLTGEQVEQLVRFRHNANGSTYSYEYGIEDYGRMKTQREVIKELAKQTAKLKNIKEIGNIIDILRDYVDTNMDLNSIKDYVPYAINMNIDNAQSEQLPGTSKYLNEISFFLYDEEKTKEIVDKLFINNVQQEIVEN